MGGAVYAGDGEDHVQGRPGRNIEEVREHQIAVLNNALRRPGMYGGEASLWILLGVLAFIDGQDPLGIERDGLQRRGAYSPVGVFGALGRILPEFSSREDAMASVYADVAHRLGWLRLDGAPCETRPGLPGDAARYCARDRSLTEVRRDFGTPSIWIGGANPYFPKTLGYATADGSALVWFHFWNEFRRPAPDQDEHLRGVHPEPMLLAVRHGEGDFLGSFTFTPEGTARKPADEDESDFVEFLRAAPDLSEVERSAEPARVVDLAVDG